MQIAMAFAHKAALVTLDHQLATVVEALSCPRQEPVDFNLIGTVLQEIEVIEHRLTDRGEKVSGTQRL